MKSIAVRASILAASCLASGVLVATQTPQAPAQDPNASGDFLKRPAVVPTDA